jgi:MFS family permease
MLPPHSDGGFHTLTPSFSKNFGICPFANVNHNVVINIGMKFFFGLSDGIWSGTVLANYLFHIGGNEYAGYAEAAMGIASLVVALPAGWAADRGSKARVIAIGGLGVPLAVALTSFAVIWSYDHTSEKVTSFWIFVAALSLWGACQSVANGPAQALYAESTPQGERSRYFNYSFSLYMAASVLGPIISIILFLLHNDTWEPVALRNVFLVGQGLSLLGGAAMLCYSERCVLDEDGTKPNTAPSNTAPSILDEDGKKPPPAAIAPSDAPNTAPSGSLGAAAAPTASVQPLLASDARAALPAAAPFTAPSPSTEAAAAATPPPQPQPQPPRWRKLKPALRSTLTGASPRVG